MRSDLQITVEIIGISPARNIGSFCMIMQRTPYGTSTSSPLLGKEFSLVFCFSHGRFGKLMQDIMGTSIPFFCDIFGRDRKSDASLEACLLMPIKILAYGVPTHTFLDYFQIMEEFGRRACMEFDAAIKQCYMDEFLCLPTAADIKSIVAKL